MRRHRLILVLVVATATVSGTLQAQSTKSFHTAAGVQIKYEDFGDPTAEKCVILLHGASGLAVPLYKDQAVFFAAHKFHVLLPHYFDATRSQSPTTENYQAWANVAAELAAECRKQASTREVFFIGYSLGASVALAAGSQGAPVDGIADWYGSLPDDFFNTMKAMPPLLILHGEHDANIPIVNAQQLVQLCEMKGLHCDHHFYADQAHGFTGKALDDADQRTIAFFSQEQ